MTRTLEEPLTEKELNHCRNEFWLLLSDFKDRQNKKSGWDRCLIYSEIQQIVDLIVVAIHCLKADFRDSPSDYKDILGAETEFFENILMDLEILIPLSLEE
jgi:hypothetical protein